MAKEIKEKHPLRLIRWANDGYPPIDFSNEGKAIIELIRDYQSIEQENKALKEKNKQLVDALEYIRERVIEKFETWADGEDVDFKTICGAVIETINNSMREYNPSHIFTPSKENNRFCDKCGKYLTDEIHQRSKNNII